MRCAVVGDPVTHSLSPVLHRAGYADLGLDWTYEAHRVAAGGLAGFLAGLDASWRGLSVTMPLKREAVALGSQVTDRARLAGAANTLVLAGGGALADNTDVPGAVAAVRERTAAPVHAATILGGGATAASVGLALLELGATTVQVLVRSPERASAAVAALSAHPSGPTVSVGSIDADAVTGDAVASTVPAAAQTPGLVARCGEVPLVFEALYDPWPTPLAASVGPDRTLVGGLDLLVHQAVRQFEAFTGESAPLAVMRAAGETALAGRSGP